MTASQALNRTKSLRALDEAARGDETFIVKQARTLRCCLKFDVEPQRLGNFSHRRKCWVALLRKCLVQPLSGNTSVSSKLAHISGAGNYAKRMNNGSRIIPPLFDDSFEVCPNIFLSVQIFR